jgi:hypothetical protein
MPVASSPSAWLYPIGGLPMAESCGADHAEMRAMNQSIHVGMEVMRNDLGQIKGLLEAMSSILRDNLITLAGHDKASSDWRISLLGTVDSMGQRVREMEITISNISDSQGVVEEFHRELADSLRLLQENRILLMQFLGIEMAISPSPLARELHESLGHLRRLRGLDPLSGEPMKSLDRWADRIGRVFELSVAGAVLMLLYKLLLPFVFSRF